MPKSAELLAQAVELKPFNRRANALLAMDLVALGRTDEARRGPRQRATYFPKTRAFRWCWRLAAVVEDDMKALEQHLHEMDPLLGKEQARFGAWLRERPAGELSQSAIAMQCVRRFSRICPGWWPIVARCGARLPASVPAG